MPNCDITRDIGETPWTDLPKDPARFGDIVRIGRLTKGMASGASSIAIAVRLPDGSYVTAQTSMLVFLNAAIFLRGCEEVDGLATAEWPVHRPSLGLATTKQLADEVLARFDVRGYTSKEADLASALVEFVERCELDQKLNASTVEAMS